MTNTDTAPATYIAKSEHKGAWVKGVTSGYRIDGFTARELGEMDMPRVSTGEIVLWEAAPSRQGGVQFFYRVRYVPQADGSIAAYASDGHLVIIHPADRKITIRTT